MSIVNVALLQMTAHGTDQDANRGNAFRRPHRYGLLTSLDVEEPFVRVDASGERYDPAER